MVKIYYNLVKNGRRTIESVPIEFRELVQTMLENN